MSKLKELTKELLEVENYFKNTYDVSSGKLQEMFLDLQSMMCDLHSKYAHGTNGHKDTEWILNDIPHREILRKLVDDNEIHIAHNNTAYIEKHHTCEISITKDLTATIVFDTDTYNELYCEGR